MSAETRALALAVGGARGAHQAGAMLLLAEKKIKFDALAGASIGALNGAHYVQGDGSTGHIERLIELWQSVSDVGIVQLSGETIKTAVALLLSRGLPTLSALLNRLMGRHVAILDPTPVAALLDRWIDYGKVCDSHVELTIAVLLEIEPLLD